MKPEIKQRIKQIKAGQVPDGYKRTRAGIMPYDWCCDREYRAKDIFKSITNKKHNGEFDVLSATQDKGVIPREQVDINIKYNKDSVAGYKKVDKGDFVISLRSFQGGIEYSEYEGLVSPAYTVLKPIIPICDKYYKYYFKTSDYINRLNIGTYGIRDGKQIGYEDFGDMVIHYPPLAEQEKIAKILSAQDRIIELYQRKIEELQKMKKVYLSKMFPKKGENVPEWRFKGFTDAWEQRKLGDVAKYRNGKAHENDISEQGKFIVVNSKFVSTNGEVRKFSNKQIEPLFKNEIAFVLSDVPNGRAIARTFLVDKNDKYTLNQRIAGITPIEGTCPYFLHILMNRNKYFLQFDDGAKQTNLSVDDVIEFAEYYPSSEEQQQVGVLFQQLDHLITLHQRKLEEMKKQKKSLMQLLLTGIVRA